MIEPFAPSGAAVEGMQEALGGLGYVAGDIGDFGWIWICPAHKNVRSEERARCEKCNEILIPMLDRP